VDVLTWTLSSAPASHPAPGTLTWFSNTRFVAASPAPAGFRCGLDRKATPTTLRPLALVNGHFNEFLHRTSIARHTAGCLPVNADYEHHAPDAFA
jgi:hypothetical protein